MTDTCSNFPACPDGERLYEAWCKVEQIHGCRSPQAKDAWRQYRKHRRNCPECNKQKRANGPERLENE
jgi:hypothetical protein